VLEVHGFHHFVHAFDYARHASRHLSRCNGLLDPARYGIDAARKAEPVERLSLLSDCIRGIIVTWL
jgi:hypothetical protein